VTLPAEAFQVTDLLALVPCTATKNWVVAFVGMAVVLGETAIELTALTCELPAGGC
jgi:hypothetical protein